MTDNKTIFWNVDTQYDFMRNDAGFRGKLPVPDAFSIEETLGYITRIAKRGNYQVVNTADWHNENTKEISDHPDFKLTFPEHCMQNSEGAAYIPATRPENPYIIDWQVKDIDATKVIDTRNIVLYKDAFDVFEGNPHTEKILSIIKPDRAIVYGVATNICVNYAVQGLLDRGIKVYVVADAIKELPGMDTEAIFEEWKLKGAEFVYSSNKNAKNKMTYGRNGHSLDYLLDDRR